MRKGDFVGNRVIDAKIVDGKYVYSNFNAAASEQSIQRDVSVWEMRFGVKYTF